MKVKGTFKKNFSPWCFARVFQGVSRGEFIRKIFSLLFKFSWMQIFLGGGEEGSDLWRCFHFFFPHSRRFFSVRKMSGEERIRKSPKSWDKLKKSQLQETFYFSNFNIVEFEKTFHLRYFCTVIATWMRSKLRKWKPLPPPQKKQKCTPRKKTAFASHLPEKRKGQKSLFSFPFSGTGSAEWVRREGRGRRGRRKVQLRREKRRRMRRNGINQGGGRGGRDWWGIWRISKFLFFERKRE